MASSLLLILQKLWPFSLARFDDLRISDKLVHRLSIPEQTKNFVFAFQDPDSQAVVYILAVQNLSERSAFDAECLIKEIRPDVVVAQVARSAVDDSQAEENNLGDDSELHRVPTSSFGVVKRCLLGKINKVHYENLAGSQVLREIFGIGFYGHFLAAKKAAEEVHSDFLLLESQFLTACRGQDRMDGNDSIDGDLDIAKEAPYLLLQSLLTGKFNLAPPIISRNYKRFLVADGVESTMVKSLASSLALTMQKLDSSGPAQSLEACDPRCNFQAPLFAQSFYCLLTDLHDMFVDLPAVGKALVYAQKMLVDVDKGEKVDTQDLSMVYNFRIAVEGLRAALNDVARSHEYRSGNKLGNVEFMDLAPEDKCHVLFAQALKSQAKKFKSVVAIVDASSLAGLRRHWNTTVPLEVADLADHCFTPYTDDGETTQENSQKKSRLAGKPVVAVGAGATAVLGASSLSKAFPASTVMKLITYKIPATFKIFLAQTQRTTAMAMGKIVGPSKILAPLKATLPGVASSGAKTSALNAVVTAEKIRVVAHSVIASAERTSFSAMRTAFYQIMRQRQRPFGAMPWATFGCSVAACTGLLVYGDGIEFAAESIPSAPTIACLGRGLRNLEQASQAMRQTGTTKIHETIQNLLYNMKKIKSNKG